MSEAYFRRLVSDPALSRAVARAPRRPGAVAVAALLRVRHGPPISRSQAERLAHRLIFQAGLPPPQTNVMVAGYELDMVWVRQRLVLDVDGWDAHRHRHRFEADRRRDAALVAAGFSVMRVTWRQLTEQPLLVVANLARALTTADALRAED